MKSRTYAEKATTWNLDEFPGVTFATVEDTNREWKFYNERFYICLVTQVPGRSRYHLRGVEGRMDAGLIYLMEPGDAIRVEEGGDGGVSYNFFVPPETMMAAAAELDPAWTTVHFPDPDLHDEDLQRLILDCGDAFSQAASLLERQSLFSELIHTVLTRHAGRAPSGNTARFGGALEKAADLIRDRLAQPLSLDELAAAAGLPRFKFLRAFKRRFALTPHDYQVKARVAKAQELLQAGETIAHAAAATGFADQSHFTRHFKRTYMMTPAEFWRRDG